MFFHFPRVDGNYSSFISSRNSSWSPIYEDSQGQSAMVLALLWEPAHQEDFNDNTQPICEFQVGFPVLWIMDIPGWALNHCTYREDDLKLTNMLWGIVGIILMSHTAGPKPLLTEFGIHHRLENYVPGTLPCRIVPPRVLLGPHWGFPP